MTDSVGHLHEAGLHGVDHRRLLVVRLHALGAQVGAQLLVVPPRLSTQQLQKTSQNDINVLTIVNKKMNRFIRIRHYNSA